MIREWDAGINPGHCMGLLSGHRGRWRPRLARRAWTSPQPQHKEGTRKMHGCSFSKADGSTGAFGDGRWTKMSTGKAESSQQLCPLRAAQKLHTWLTLKLHRDKLSVPRGVLYQVGVWGDVSQVPSPDNLKATLCHAWLTVTVSVPCSHKRRGRAKPTIKGSTKQLSK